MINMAHTVIIQEIDNGVQITDTLDVEAWGKVAFGFTTNYADSGANQKAETRFFVPTNEA